jgi:hypothetical protein
MKEKTIIDHLESNREVIGGLLNDFSGEESNWKQADEKWSALEIVCHLVDEEIHKVKPIFHNMLMRLIFLSLI